MYLLFDIGGTSTRIAVASSLETFEEPSIFETPQDFDAALATIKQKAEEILAGRELEGVIGGVPGLLNEERTALLQAPNLQGWNHAPLRERLEEMFGAPAQLRNDAALVGLGEVHFGAGQGYKVVAYITVSTGVGGTRVVGGRLDESVPGFEPGHQFIDIDRTACPQCNSGELEQMISGRNLEARTGKKPNEITDPAVWDELARYLAVGLANTIVHWIPQAVVLGGSMIVRKPGIDIEAVNRHLKEFLNVVPLPQIKEAKLGALGGLYGALALAREHHTARNAHAVISS